MSETANVTDPVAEAMARMDGWTCSTPQDDADLRLLLSALREAREDGKRIEWLEAQSRERESLMLGWNRADGDHNEFTGESYDWPESFFAIYEDQEGQPFGTLRAAIDAARTGDTG